MYFKYQNSYQFSDILFNVKSKFNDVTVNFNKEEQIIYNVYQETSSGKICTFLEISIIQHVQESVIDDWYEQRNNLDIKNIDLIESFSFEKTKELNNLSDSLLRQFRWLTDLPFDLTKKKTDHILWWSKTSELGTWEIVPMKNTLAVSLGAFIGYDILNILEQEKLVALISNNIHLEEPLAYDMLNEALRLHENGDLRGAFMLGFSALEIGIKYYIRKKSPDTTWLLANSPSPDILKICSVYLPTLDTRLDIEKSTEKKLIKKYMESRNKLVHTGLFIENWATVLQYLYMVKFMLHRFDLCLGLERAKLYAEQAKVNMERL